MLLLEIIHVTKRGPGCRVGWNIIFINLDHPMNTPGFFLQQKVLC